MKFLLSLILSTGLFILASFVPVKKLPLPGAIVSPLASYSTDWNDTKYLKCNTAAAARYMTATEKELIYILNLARMDPDLFAKSVVKKYPVGHSGYYSSLLLAMQKLKSLPLLYPDSLCFAGAQCHAINSGAEGYVGHDRSTESCRKKWYYNGECCDYGHGEPIDIIMALLIDEGVSSLGHREICLGNYKKIGVSIQPHRSYRYTAVLDLHY